MGTIWTEFAAKDAMSATINRINRKLNVMYNQLDKAGKHFEKFNSSAYSSRGINRMNQKLSVLHTQLDKSEKKFSRFGRGVAIMEKSVGVLASPRQGIADTAGVLKGYNKQLEVAAGRQRTFVNSIRRTNEGLKKSTRLANKHTESLKKYGKMFTVTAYTQKLSRVSSVPASGTGGVRRKGGFGGGGFGGISGSIGKFGSVVGSLWMGEMLAEAAVRPLIETSDNLTGVRARLNILEKNPAKAAEIEQRLMERANAARSDYASYAGLFAKAGVNARSAFTGADGNLNYDKLFNFTDFITKVGIVGGATTEELNSLQTQFLQGYGSGYIGGEELKAVKEAAPMFAEWIADYFGVAVAELTDIGAEAKITQGVLDEVMSLHQDELEKMYAGMPPTFSQAGSVLGNTFTEAFNNTWGTAFMEIPQWIVDNQDSIRGKIEAALSGIKVAVEVATGNDVGEEKQNGERPISKVTEFFRRSNDEINEFYNPSVSDEAYTYVKSLDEAIAQVQAKHAINRLFTNNSMYQYAPVNQVTQTQNRNNVVMPETLLSFDAEANGVALMERLSVGVESGVQTNLVPTMSDYVVPSINGPIEGLDSYAWGADMVNMFAQGMRDNIVNLQAASLEMVGAIHPYLHFSEPDKGPLSDFHTYMPDMVDLMVRGIRGGRKDVGTAAAGLAGVISNSFTRGIVKTDSEAIKETEVSDYMLALAGREAVNKYTTGHVNVDMSGMRNTLNNSGDIDGFINRLTAAVRESLDIMNEGAFA